MFLQDKFDKKFNLLSLLSKKFIMFEKTELQVLKNRLPEGRKFIQVVVKPRQVEKTTMLTQFLKHSETEAIYESADATPYGAILVI